MVFTVFSVYSTMPPFSIFFMSLLVCWTVEGKTLKRDGVVELPRSVGNVNSSSRGEKNETSGTGNKALPCIDHFSDSYCKARMARRGKEYCRKDLYFGRMQCCATCLKAWNEETGITSGNVTAWFIACEDFTNPDGTSLTSWCQEFTSPSKKKSIFGCNKSLFVKYRCMKTCGFC